MKAFGFLPRSTQEQSTQLQFRYHSAVLVLTTRQFRILYIFSSRDMDVCIVDNTEFGVQKYSPCIFDEFT